tara:strand:+ start:870 stop:1136 length:267 start_codon:yes stop_codon:yes gene_type:complete
MLEDVSGFKIIIPEGHMKTVPLDCDICGFLMRDYSDASLYSKYGCCASCFMKWVEYDIDGWHAGRRPTSNEIEKEKEKRLLQPSYLVK